MESGRSLLSRAIGELDFCAAALSRAEHGPARDTVADARRSLKRVAADLLVLRAHLAERPMIPIDVPEDPAATAVRLTLAR